MTNKTLAERLRAIDGISKGINEKAGKEIAGRITKQAGLAEYLNTRFIRTPSLKVNDALGGGWPKGNVSVVCGTEDSGKTMYLLETIALNQRENPEFIAVWLESEHSLKESALNMFGIDKERFIIIEHDRKGAGEEAINRLEAYLASGVADMVVINSLKALVPSEEFAKDMNSVQVGLQARMNSKLMRKITAVVQESDTAMVIVQHLTTQIGGPMHADPKILAGGMAIRFGAMLIADFRKKSIGESDPVKREEAMKIGVTIKKNHVIPDRFPYLKADYYITYGEGTEVYLETIELAISQGILMKNGAFIKLPDENGDPQMRDGVKMQWQGLAKFRDYCKNNPEFFKEIQSKLTGEAEVMSDQEIMTAKFETGDTSDLLVEDVIKKANKAKGGKK